MEKASSEFRRRPFFAGMLCRPLEHTFAPQIYQQEANRYGSSYSATMLVYGVGGRIRHKDSIPNIP